MCPELQSLKEILERGLTDTAPLWPNVRAGFAIVHRAAAILENPKQSGGSTIRRTLASLLKRVRRRARGRGSLAISLRHFFKVSASYWSGLFYCYDVPGLPRTNNALEQLFGSTRHHERRCTGRKAASPGLVLRGSVRIVAGLGTRQRCFAGSELAPPDLRTWKNLRASLDHRRQARTLRRRFRNDPAAYFAQLEALLLKRALPP